MLEIQIAGRGREAFVETPQIEMNPEADPFAHENNETEEQAARRIALKYEAMERLNRRIVEGKLPSLIVSGPPGMQKSWTTKQTLKHSARKRFSLDALQGLEDFGATVLTDTSKFYDEISGGCTAPGLYHSLWNMRNGGLVVIDDCDSVFTDLEALNLLKIATDSSEERHLSWRKRSHWLEEHGIKKDFEFRGHVVFLTNIDFEQIIKKTGRAGGDIEHYKALIDRAHYLCLTLRTYRDFMIRIRTVSEGPNGILQAVYGLTPAQEQAALGFIDKHRDRFYNLSIRLVCHIAQTMLADPDNWQRDCFATKMKTNL